MAQKKERAEHMVVVHIFLDKIVGGTKKEKNGLKHMVVEDIFLVKIVGGTKNKKGTEYMVVVHIF